MLGCVIFFPWLTYVVKRGVRGGAVASLRCADCTAGGGHRGGAAAPPVRGVWGGRVAPLYGVWGSAPGNFFFGPYIRLGKPTYGFSVHGFGRDGFRSMVLDASACINMYCNIERNIMKNKTGSPGFGIQGKMFQKRKPRVTARSSPHSKPKPKCYIMYWGSNYFA